MNGKLKLEGLLENFDAIEDDGAFHFIEHEIETDEGEFVFVDLWVGIEISKSEVVSSNVEINCHPEYFALDRWGEEKECMLEGYEMAAIEKEITERIEDKLK